MPRLSYERKERNGFVWTSDTVRGRNGFTRHRMYLVADRNDCLGIIERARGLYRLKLVGSDLPRTFGSLSKAKATAEMYVSKNFHQLGFELRRVKRARV